MRIGFEDQTGHVFEGSSIPQFAVWPPPLLSRPGHGLGALLVIGQTTGVTLWRVIQVELALDSAVVITLKSKSAFGVLPEVAWDVVPDEGRALVRSALERVMDSAFREAPVSMIDQCRNAATVVLSRWLAGEGRPEFLGKDLADLAKAVDALPHSKQCVSWLAQTLARLHARGKSNEQSTKNLREPNEEDAAFALHSLSFLLREIGWASA